MSDRRSVIDIITRLQARAQEGSKSDRQLARMVLDDLDFASKASISEMAARIGVSEPTVTRFCRSLGLDGTRDFKFWIAQALAVGGQYLAANPAPAEAEMGRIPQLVAEGAAAAVQRAAGAVDMAVIQTVAERLTAATQVLALGSGGTSSMMATEMQNRLYRLGIAAIAQVDGQLQRMFAATATKGTVVIAFSTSGYAQSVVDAVAVAGQYGATTIAVTAPGSALAEAATHVVEYQPAEDGNLYKPTSSRFALLALVDIIAMAVAEHRGTRALETLRRVKQSINTFKVDNPKLPLGD
ncbi:MurR/RpiR family transcriptional regulator [Frigidibacter sp. SD6-1]|uniref:MurR/RpiR family transcriptional regulator n=1 Tax=Frigidibacter sp. SD6-1 TaxID=3032581 RepID=UPI0024E03522|nr:MurR/RpiR family transcriptional regulator [Frigidibacter sp. SD6-1]